jgi:hypothetical protein
MPEQTYLFLSIIAIFGVIISYIIPIIGGITHVQIIETDEIELAAF